MRAFLSLILLLSACDSEVPSMPGIDPVRVEVDGRIWDVYAEARTARAIRMSFDTDISRERARLRGLLAIERATGCTALPDSLTGDQVIVSADIIC